MVGVRAVSPALPDTNAAPEGMRPWDRKPPETQPDGGPPPPPGGPPPPPGGPPPPIDPGALPKRPRHCPAVLNDSTLAAWTLPWKQHKRDTLTVIVKATCDLVDGGPAVLRADPTIPSGDVHVGDDVAASLRYPSDFAVFKPKSDVVFNGVAHAPSPGTRATEINFSFGGRSNRFSRKLAVFGDRSWSRQLVGAAPSDPKRFERVELTWENAYGGPSHPANPVGVGAADDASNRVPALENPAKLMRSRGDTPLPTCFAPVAAAWPLRWSKMGTYDAAWQAERWPHFPADFDWAHFQAAPLAQQLEYLRGDEPFSVTGVRPGGADLSGSLPGIVPRMFVCREERRALTFSELELRLDTVVLDGEAMTVDLVWRGVLEVSASTAPEVAALFLRVQMPGDPELTLDAAHAQLVATLNPPKAPARRLPLRPPANDEAADTPQIDSVRDDLRAAGIPETWFKKDLSPAAVHPTPAELAAAGGATSDPVIHDALRALSDRTAAATATRGHAISLLEAGGSLDGVELSGADLSGLDFSGKSLVGAKLDGANLRLANFTGADLTEALISGSDCRGTLLPGANLTQADFVDATLDDADLAGAELGSARFTRASGQRANFTGAKGERAGFVEGNWRDARFDRAELAHGDWSEAVLHGVSFERAQLPHLRLYQAEGEGVQLDGADIRGARALGVKLRDAKLRQVNAASSVWDDAVLERCDWSAADLTEASLCGATCEASIFSRARMKGARLCAADLREASFLEADLMEASFEDSKLHKTDLRGANLYGAETLNAELEGTRLAGAFIAGTKLEQR